MATGRTHLKYSRVYLSGYDMSGYSRSWGPLMCKFDEGVDDALSLNIKGAMLGQATVGIGTLTGLFDNTATSGLHVIANGAGVVRNVMIAIGICAVPANNDPVFSAALLQGEYSANNENPVTVTIPFANAHVTAGHLTYARPWGALLHANAVATAANSATGLDQDAATTKGGWMMYQVTAGNGTANIKVQDASTNSDGSFGDLLTSGVISCTAGVSGVVALADTATVKRYVRWQIALSTATTVTFALSWHRGI